MQWKDRELVTKGDVANAMQGLKTEQEADAFMEVMRTAGPHAEDNIGYMVGYFSDPEVRHRLYKWLKVKHPVFGGVEANGETG